MCTGGVIAGAFLKIARSRIGIGCSFSEHAPLDPSVSSSVVAR